MNPSPKDLLVWLSVLAVSLALFLATYPSGAQPLQSRRGGERVIPFAASFSDFGQRQPSISCEISADGHQREIGSVGFTARQRAIWLSRNMYQKARQELPDVNDQLAIYGCSANVFESKSISPGKDWEIDESLSCSSDNPGFAAEARRAVQEWMARLDRDKDRMLAEFYRARRIRVLKSSKAKAAFHVDYAPVVKSAKLLLAGCARALYQEGGNRLDANLFTAFLQQLEYVELKPLQGEYHVRDFMVPTQVLVEAKGDCDSKSAAFCALWMTYSNDVILLMSDHHTLIGYREVPTTHLPTFTVKGIPYVPCDVSGLHRFKCGNVPSGNYRPVFVND